VFYMTGNGTYFFYNHNRTFLLDPYRDSLKPKTTFLKEYITLCNLIDDLNVLTNMLGEDYGRK